MTTSILARARFEVHRVDDRTPRVVLQGDLDDARFGGVDHQRRFGRLREFAHHLAHLHVFIRALGERDADVEDVRAAFDLLARDQRDRVVILLEQQALDLARALRVDAFADDQRPRFLFERDGGHRRGDGLHAARLRARARHDRFDRSFERGDVRGRRTAAAADDVHAELAHETGELARKFVRCFGINRFALRAHQRKTGIRDDAHETPRVVAQIAHRVAHLRRPCGAVEADHVDRQRIQRRTHGGDIRAEQHAAFGDQRRLRLNRHAPQPTIELANDAGDGGFEFEHVLHRLEQQQIGTAFNQIARLLAVGIAQLRVGDLRERRVRRRDQHAGRAHRARDEARPLGGGEFIAGFARGGLRGATTLISSDAVAQT